MAESTDKSVLDHYQTDSPVGTEFLRLYHNLVHANNSAAGPHSFLITSATVGEGKSTAASYLALTLSTIKKKTLLIDGDLRRPTIHTSFNMYLEDGVTEVADGSLPQARAYKESSRPNLFIMSAGRLRRDPSSYYEDGHVARILDQAKPRFDFIIIDCAPVMPVVDPIVIAPYVSGVLLVVLAGVTHRDLVKQATQVLTNAKAPLKGVLLNNVKGVLPYHYSYRYAYEYYKPGAEKPQKEK